MKDRKKGDKTMFTIGGLIIFEMLMLAMILLDIGITLSRIAKSLERYEDLQIMTKEETNKT